MILNRFLRCSVYIFIASIFIACLCDNLRSESDDIPEIIFNYSYYEGTARKVLEVQAEIKEKTDELKEMIGIKNGIEEAIGKIDENSRMNALQSVISRFAQSEVGAVMALVKQIREVNAALEIVPKLETLNMDIGTFVTNEIDYPIYRRKKTGYNDVWDRYVQAYSKLKGIELQRANLVEFGENDQVYRTEQLRNRKKTLPNPDLITLKECNGTCGAFYKNAEEHQRTCPSCNEVYYRCTEKDYERHRVKYCGREIKFYTTDSPMSRWSLWRKHSLGICGEKYRDCDDPPTRKIHDYRAFSGYNYANYNGIEGYYLRSYRNALNATKCGKGTTTPPSKSIYGPNGVGFASDDFDKSPNCNSCICGSRTCPDAPTNHPKEKPGPVTFSLSRSAVRGSIVLTWNKPDFDGFTRIYDYEYKMEYKGSDGNYHLHNDWQSVGRIWYYRRFTGLHSGTEYRVSICARNKEGTSSTRYYKYITTK